MSIKTVYVIGAGASHEAKLPTGDKLKEIIAELLDINIDGGGPQNLDNMLSSKSA